MQPVALVTDTTAGLSPDTAARLGVTVAPAGFAFQDEPGRDGDSAWDDIYQRMERSGVAPRTFGVPESSFRAAFEQALELADAVLAVVTPFDLNPSFTTACAAMLALQFDSPDARVKVVNAGVGATGLVALMLTLGDAAKAGASLDELLALIETVEPECDSLFIPGGLAWLERAGRLAALEDRLGSLEGRVPILRVGTRITGVALQDSRPAALAWLASEVGRRSPAGPVNATVLHADSSVDAEQLAELLRSKLSVERLEISRLSVAHGAQLGPGAVGAGVCPVRSEGQDA